MTIFEASGLAAIFVAAAFTLGAGGRARGLTGDSTTPPPTDDEPKTLAKYTTTSTLMKKDFK